MGIPQRHPYSVESLENPASVKRIGFQSWTDENLLIKSEHEGVPYYTTRWDALCPYIDVSEEMLNKVPKPFVVYALPPDGPFGVPINDQYGMAETLSKEFWEDERRARKFRTYDKSFRSFTHEARAVPGSALTLDDMLKMGGAHFADCDIEEAEILGFLDYVSRLDVLIITAHSPEGELALTDVSILLPKYDQVYGSFCQWNPAFKNKSPGLYACLLAARWAAQSGYRYYNLGPVGGYDYKSLFVTARQPIYSLVLTDLDHPLALDSTSPLNTDFNCGDWNRVYREVAQPLPRMKRVG
jgi:hypothetical protein